jgi:HD-like signal output (HDOD) protein
MTRVLFVDDEPMVLRALDRGLRGRKRTWQASFAGSGAEALEQLEREMFDVVISDISMPMMDGYTLLHNVRAKHPHIARLALSGEYAASQNLGGLIDIHQWISKPCSLAKLCGTIEQLSWVRSLVDDDGLRTAITQLASLPSPPTLFLQVSEALARGAPHREIATIVKGDPAMALKLLQLVNSSFFADGERITSIDRALELVTCDRLHELLLAAEVFRSEGSPELAAHSRLVARIARQLAPAEVADDAFVAGFLHDVGCLALADRSIDKALAGASVLHARLAGLLLGSWGLPGEIVTAVAFHHDAEAAPTPASPTLRALALAEALVEERESGVQRTDVETHAAALGLDPATCRVVAAGS